MTKKGVLQGGEQMTPLFAQRRQVRAKTAKDVGSPRCAEAARDLLLHFDHANISLGLGIIKRHTQVMQEGENRVLVQREAIEQIARRRLFGPPLFLDGGGRIRRIGLIAFFQYPLIAGDPVSDLQRRERAAPHLSCLITSGLHLPQHVFELGGPALLVLFLKEKQFAQVMDIAQRVQAPVEPVAAKAIMQASALKLRQDADGVQGFFAAFGMDRIVGQRLGGTDVRPPALARHIQAAFILMEHVGLDQRLFDLLLYRFKQRGGPLHLGDDRGLRDGDAQQIKEHFASPSQRQQMLHHQQARCRGHAASVLHVGSHLLGEGRRVHLAT